jgi:hypothetical protein
VRNNRTFRELLALLHEVALERDDVLRERDQVLFFGTSFGVLQNQFPLAANGAAHFDYPVDLRNLGRILSDAALRRARPHAADHR